MVENFNVHAALIQNSAPEKDGYENQMANHLP